MRPGHQRPSVPSRYSDRTGNSIVRLPMSGIRSLVRKLFLAYVEVSCYPGGEAEDDE